MLVFGNAISFFLLYYSCALDEMKLLFYAWLLLLVSGLGRCEQPLISKTNNFETIVSFDPYVYLFILLRYMKLYIYRVSQKRTESNFKV